MKWPAQRLASGSKKSFGMYDEAAKLDAAGVDLIHLEFGRPHADTPDHIKQATKAALDAGIVHYGDFRGTLSFRQALVKKLRDFNKLDYGVDEVLVTNGLTHASFAAFMAAIDPGDEVILLDPYYPQHIGKTQLAGGKVVIAHLDEANGFAITKEAIAAKITERTRMIVLINPANPTGRVYTRAELQHIADLAIEHDLLVLSDEVYEYITYDGAEHVSIASLPGMRERTITCFAFTKAYSMDGWRVGYVTADARLMPAILTIAMTDVTHVNVFVQEGARAAVEGPQEPMLAMVEAPRLRPPSTLFPISAARAEARRISRWRSCRKRMSWSRREAFTDPAGKGISASASGPNPRCGSSRRWSAWAASSTHFKSATYQGETA